MTRDAAIKNFGRRGGWWTQDEGLALVLATERLGGTGWRACAFGSGALAGVELLDQALDGSRGMRVRAVDRSCRISSS